MHAVRGGWGGRIRTFDPGSKAPRLTTWPRPNARGLATPAEPSFCGGVRPPLGCRRGDAGAGRRPAACRPPRTFSSRYWRIWLLSGWAMSLNVPSFRFLLGIETNRPFGPWMTLMSVTTKQWSKTIDTNALSFSSSTGMTLTSVISMLTAPSRPSTAPSANPRTGPRRPGTGRGSASAPRGPGSPRAASARCARPAGRAVIEQPEVARRRSRESREPRALRSGARPGCAPACSRRPGASSSAASSRSLARSRYAPAPSNSLDTK